MKNMLVVVDYQKDFVDGSLGFSGAEDLDAGIAAKIDAAADRGDVIVATKDTHGVNYLQSREGKALPVEHCLNSTAGWEFFGKTRAALERLSAERYGPLILLSKGTFGVAPADMCAFVDKYAEDEVEFVGLVTNMCILANVCCFQACFPAAQMVVDASLVASFDNDLHEKTLDVLAGMQVRVENRKRGGPNAQ